MTQHTKQTVLRRPVRQDLVDRRDMIFQPRLSILRDRMTLDPRLMVRLTGTADHPIRPVFGVRDQGRSGRCAGHALAALIDIQRNLMALGQAPQADRPATVDEACDPCRPDLPYNRIVSADMLYYMALRQDRYPDLAMTEQPEPDEEDDRAAPPRPEGVATLRSVIKGFYHHGVCPDWPHPEGVSPHCWQSESFGGPDDAEQQKGANVEQTKKAREIGLGAYFRLRPILNHYHAALNEAEAILVAANIHQGWNRPYDPAAEGVITRTSDDADMGTHAFVIVGYDARGFLVLNSWGPDWGGYGGQQGVALWPYEDWARTILDGWVLRLGVSAPSSHGAIVGEQGIGGIVGTRMGATPCLELVGHYMNLDDGVHVADGAYPSYDISWSRTETHLDNVLRTRDGTGKYDGVLLWLPGTLDGIKDEFQRAVARKEAIKTAGLYPYTVFWCNTFVDKSREVLTGLFDSCVAEAGETAIHLPDLIESRVRGVGRAFWRDIERGARHAVHGLGESPGEMYGDRPRGPLRQGYVMRMVEGLFRLAVSGRQVHLVAEGAGVLVLDEILAFVAAAADAGGDGADRMARAADLFSSVHLVAPAIDLPRAARRVIPLMERMNGCATGAPGADTGRPRAGPLTPGADFHPRSRARLYLPDAAFERRLCFGAYNRSILHLVSRAFEDRYLRPDQGGDPLPAGARYGAPRMFLGMADAPASLPPAARRGIILQSGIADDNHIPGRVQQTRLNDDRTVGDDILDSIATLRAPARA